MSEYLNHGLGNAVPENGAKPTVILIDDDTAIRESVGFLLSSVQIEVVSYSSAIEFLERGGDETKASCLLLDVRMAGMSGLELLDELATRRYETPVIVLTGHADVPMAVRAMKAGAFDFIEKPFNQQALLEQVGGAMAHYGQQSRRNEDRSEVRARFDRLTPREREVFARVVDGLPNRVIAEELGITEKTVELHRSNVMRKMEANSLAHLVRMSVTGVEAVA